MITLAQALTNGSGNERKFTCPVHADSTPSASVNVAKGVWYCYTCHSHGTVDGAVYDEVDGDAVYAAVVEILAEHETEFRPEGWLDQYDAGGLHEYWLGRFEPATVAHFRLGYDAVKDAATYPLRSPAGHLLGVVRRDLSGTTAKYRYPRGARTTDLLFNYSADSVSEVLLTEGATDAMAAWEAGYPSAFACFSNRVSSQQLWLLRRIAPERIVVCFDDDEAGWHGTESLQRSLNGEFPLHRATFGGAKDLAELSPAQRRESISDAIAL